ncbi:MAG: leucine-rich repeat protein [Lachnospiraceae bacterium]|nr:leucine-rich repeat protein [Lachnospiraceae bacterium]
MISLQCPNCGSHLDYDSAKKIYHCPFCESVFFADTESARNDDFDIQTAILYAYKGKSPNILIPDGVKKIGEHCFAGMCFIESVSIPESLTEIGANAFNGCAALREINFHEKFQIIGAGAFKDSGLRHVVLPESLLSIGEAAFMNCNLLESAVIPSYKGIAWKRTFKSCSALENVQFNLADFFPSFIQNELTMRNGDKRSTLFDAFQDTPLFYRLREKVWNKQCLFCGGELDKKYHCGKCEITYTTGKREGCYIATAVYGSYNSPQVRVLRRYRDSVLAKSIWGRLFIRIYYAFSPFLVKHFAYHSWFRKSTKKTLDCIVHKLEKI